MSLPEEHQKRLRTTNLCERVNRELKRRRREVGVFPNAAVTGAIGDGSIDGDR
jgi:transposase-like protein